MAGTISLNDAVSASRTGFRGCPRLALSRAIDASGPYRHPTTPPARHERDWFFWLAYSAGVRPGALLRQFAESVRERCSCSLVSELGEPKNQRRLIRPADRALFSFTLEIETSRRAYARAHADGLSLSAIMRRFVVDYVRRERAARASEAAPVQPKPKRTKGRSSRLKE